MPSVQPRRRCDLAFFAFPTGHWTKLRSTNPLERLLPAVSRYLAEACGPSLNRFPIPAGRTLMPQINETSRSQVEGG